MVYNEAQKQAIYKWREAHKDKIKEQKAKDMRKYYEKNCEKLRQRATEYYYNKKAQQEMEILTTVLL